MEKKNSINILKTLSRKDAKGINIPPPPTVPKMPPVQSPKKANKLT